MIRSVQVQKRRFAEPVAATRIVPEYRCARGVAFGRKVFARFHRVGKRTLQASHVRHGQDGAVCLDGHANVVRIPVSDSELDKHAVSTRGLAKPICACLEGPMAQTVTVSSGNKSPLYERAVGEGMPCVRPLR